MLIHLAIERGLAQGDACLGLLADPRDLGLRPFAHGGDVVVRVAAEFGGFHRGCGMDLFDDGLGVGAEAGHGLVARGLDGGLHGAAQLGHELRGPAGAGGGGRIDHIGRLRLLGGSGCLLGG